MVQITKNVQSSVAGTIDSGTAKTKISIELSPSDLSKELSKDSLIQNLRTSTNSYDDEGDIFPASKSLRNDIFRTTMDKENREESSSTIGDDMSLSVATSADFSFATQNTSDFHYPAQYNPLQQQEHDTQRTTQTVGGEVRDPEEKEGKKFQDNPSQKKSWKDRINRNNSSKNSDGAENELFCCIGTAFKCCLYPVNEEEEGKTKNRASEMRDFFSPCIRSTLDSTVEATDEKSVTEENTVCTSADGSNRSTNISI